VSYGKEEKRRIHDMYECCVSETALRCVCNENPQIFRRTNGLFPEQSTLVRVPNENV
jgi:hypothetical protein